VISVPNVPAKIACCFQLGRMLIPDGDATIWDDDVSLSLSLLSLLLLGDD